MDEKTPRSLQYRIARAWASIEGKIESFDTGETRNDELGHFQGYMAEAAELMKRTGLVEPATDPAAISAYLKAAGLVAVPEEELAEMQRRLGGGEASATVTYPRRREPMRDKALEAAARAVYEAWGFAYDERCETPHGEPYGGWARAVVAAPAAVSAYLSAAGLVAVPEEATNEMLAAMHRAMYVEEFDGTNLPMLGAGYDAATAVAKKENGDG